MSKSKKIVFKVEEFPHLSETFIIAQMVTAIQLGYEIEILTRKILNVKESTHEDFLNEYHLLDKVVIEDYNIPKIKTVRFFKWIMLLIINFKDLNYIFKFHKEFSKFSLTWLYQWCFYNKFNKVDIFHVQYGTNSNSIAALKKTSFFKPSLLVTFHGHDAFFPINGIIPNNGYYNNLFKYGDLITANTPYLADKIIELGCPKELLSIVPVGVNTEFFYSKKEKKESNDALKLITVGRLDKVKGHQFCIEAVHQLTNKGIDVTLTIIGEGVERNCLERLITDYQLEERVFMKGKKSRFEIRQILCEHDVYLLLAVALPDGRRETQGLATIEAQACGLPVIVFDSGGVKYTLNDGVSGFLCEEYDVEGVSNKILKFIKKIDLLSTMGEQAVNFVNENYSQKIINKKWEMIYSNLSNGK
jgi:colanic acid/amylovoran biosynthesis glycosyltransferase